MSARLKSDIHVTIGNLLGPAETLECVDLGVGLANFAVSSKCEEPVLGIDNCATNEWIWRNEPQTRRTLANSEPHRLRGCQKLADRRAHFFIQDFQ
jgi:hypothetical protein